MHYNNDKFIQKVCEQIGFKAARKGIEQELKAHIDDNIEQFIAQGLDEKTAIIKATECMGDPIEIGEALNRIHRPQTEWGVISLVILLSIFGIGTMFFIGDLPAGSSSIFGKKQIVYAILGMGFLVGIYLFDYMKLCKYGRKIFLSGIILTITTVLFGTNENGILCLKMGEITFTTAFICNLMFMIYVIAELSKCRGEGIIAFLKICSLCAISLILLFFNMAFALSLIMLIVYAIILTVAAIKGHFNYEKRWSYICATWGISVISLIALIPHMMLINYNPHNSEYSTNMVSKYLEGSQWIGKSAFLNAHGWRYLPKHWADYFLTIIITNFGWIIGCLIISFLIVLFSIMIFRTLNLKNTYGFYLSVGIVVYLIINFVLNILITMGYVNNLDCNLSFISFGGTDYLNNIFVVGLFLSVWRRNLIMPSDMYSSLTHYN
ncbi:FtsW/RodA/SpoVE family cell cycle protein [Clostridium kluyveri]|uniref:Uncharacterized protein n=1 Tax=Clostridium kluyveri TaxID=1534 RepID=A0A1L5FCZ3_CLOKL|nr:FtsW/RodA/SpoVE family cell cycle protein [Clostridium kluyveri]APM40690.1 hypothetical protein BS101_19140 [Clostridium kluyveri]